MFKKIESLRADLFNNQSTTIAYKYNIKRAIYEYLIRLIETNYKIQASEEAVRIIYIISSEGLARQIRNTTDYWLQHNTLSKSNRGCHQKVKCLIDNEDITKKCKA